MDSKQLHLLCVKENGLGEAAAAKLSSQERALLEKRTDGKYVLLPSERAKFKVVLTGGVFDILHPGHALTLERARALGDILVVVVSTDARVEQVKKRKPIHSAEERCNALSALLPVDLALVGKENMMETFERVQPDIVAFGYDQQPFALPAHCKSVHLAEVELKGHKTSQIIRELGLEGKTLEGKTVGFGKLARNRKPIGNAGNPAKEGMKPKRSIRS